MHINTYNRKQENFLRHKELIKTNNATEKWPEEDKVYWKRKMAHKPKRCYLTPKTIRYYISYIRLAKSNTQNTMCWEERG